MLQHEIDLIAQAGVNIRLNTEIGKDVTFKTLQTQYDAVYVATGTQFPEKVNIPVKTSPASSTALTS